MQPPFAPYIPMMHPDDLLPIERIARSHRVEISLRETWHEEKYASVNVRPLIAQLGNWLIVLGRRLEQIGMTSSDSSEEHRLPAV